MEEETLWDPENARCKYVCSLQGTIKQLMYLYETKASKKRTARCNVCCSNKCPLLCLKFGNFSALCAMKPSQRM